jgi:hypothetical protein
MGFGWPSARIHQWGFAVERREMKKALAAAASDLLRVHFGYPEGHLVDAAFSHARANVRGVRRSESGVIRLTWR